MKKYYYISLALHALLLIGLLFNKQPHPQQQRQPAFVSMSEGKENLPQKPKTPEIIPQTTKGDTIKPCDDFYYGIGFIHGQGGEVLSVYEGYPAYEGGLRRGDYVLNIDDIPHQDGVSFVLIFQRDNITIERPMTSRKICTNP